MGNFRPIASGQEQQAPASGKQVALDLLEYQKFDDWYHSLRSSLAGCTEQAEGALCLAESFLEAPGRPGVPQEDLEDLRAAVLRTMAALDEIIPAASGVMELVDEAFVVVRSAVDDASAADPLDQDSDAQAEVSQVLDLAEQLPSLVDNLSDLAAELLKQASFTDDLLAGLPDQFDLAPFISLGEIVEELPAVDLEVLRQEFTVALGSSGAPRV